MKKLSKKAMVIVLTLVMVLGSAVNAYAASISKTMYTSCGPTSTYVSIKHTITKNEAGDKLTFRADANTTSAYKSIYHIQYQAQIYMSVKSVTTGKTSYTVYNLNETYDISQANGAVLPYTLEFNAKDYYKTIDGETYRGETIVWTGNVTATITLKDGRTATNVIEGLER